VPSVLPECSMKCSKEAGVPSVLPECSMKCSKEAGVPSVLPDSVLWSAPKRQACQVFCLTVFYGALQIGRRAKCSA